VYEPRTWTNLGAIFLPGLTMARHENRKVRYENELLKAKEPAPDVYKCRIYQMTPKNITCLDCFVPQRFTKCTTLSYLFKCMQHILIQYYESMIAQYTVYCQTAG
jgi:hypothetical protein